ncbi:lysylphosphatidylglycerol synthase transmembrane domain-containing protein [Azospirillum sp.]|uniref:lysylphosphatidylglycerol synthase transmembrane domain-containing protein n=1 Tax=Azospirillum sp. TaxID=34012 RepID=UPI002632DFB6|nr:lysylphosphatidylglycerol synthase transmembrane domain-containing protein [Azospirillum sp.]
MAYAVKLLISGALLAFLLHRFDVADAARQLALVNPWHALAAATLYASFHVVNAAKLQLVIPGRRVRSILAFVLVAQAYSLLLPGQLAGEAVKAYRLARGSGEGGRVVSSVAFDKMTSLVALLLTTLGGLLVEAHRFGNTLFVALVAGLVLIAFSSALLALTPVRRLTGSFLSGDGWRGRFGGPINLFLDTWTRHVARPQTMALSLAYGLAAQLIQALATQILGAGLGIELSFALWCVIIGALTVLLLAPVTIGGLGLREASLVGMLGLFAVTSDRALAVALAILAFQLLITVVGLAVDLLVLRNH